MFELIVKAHPMHALEHVIVLTGNYNWTSATPTDRSGIRHASILGDQKMGRDI